MQIRRIHGRDSTEDSIPTKTKDDVKREPDANARRRPFARGGSENQYSSP